VSRPSAAAAESPTVRLDRVSADYDGRAVWTGLSVEVAAGELVAVLGPNGAGKTTLLRLLLGHHRPSAGRVEVLGAAPRRGNPGLGYVAQHRSFDPDLPLRGADYVRLGLDGHRWGVPLPSHAVRAAVARALEAAGAGDFAASPVGRLSGGEQQRLRIAQALVAGPALLLADEPLASLDLASQAQVMALLDQRRRRTGMAVVVVTHELDPVLPYADTVVYLAPGGWAAGPPAEVLTSAMLSRLHGTQVDVLRVRDRVVIVGQPRGVHPDTAAPFRSDGATAQPATAGS